MAVADRTLDAKLLASARREFLQNGFEKASLKTICDGAGATTGALYKRYKNKEALFAAAVEQTVQDLTAVAQERGGKDPAAMTDEELLKAWDMDQSDMLWWFRFLYDRHDDFVLLLACAQGTRYASFPHDWVSMLTKATSAYLAEAQKRGLCSAGITPQELHILLSAFWETIYEPFLHGFDWQTIEAHCKIVCRLFHWQEALGFCPVG